MYDHVRAVLRKTKVFSHLSGCTLLRRRFPGAPPLRYGFPCGGGALGGGYRNLADTARSPASYLHS